MSAVDDQDAAEAMADLHDGVSPELILEIPARVLRWNRGKRKFVAFYDCSDARVRWRVFWFARDGYTLVNVGTVPFAEHHQAKDITAKTLAEKLAEQFEG